VFVRHSFFGNTTGNPPSDGAAPMAGLFLDAHGALWGTTSAGGGSALDRTGCGYAGSGTVFKLTPSALPLLWKYEVEYRFFGLVDGGVLMSPLAGRLRSMSPRRRRRWIGSNGSLRSFPTIRGSTPNGSASSSSTKSSAIGSTMRASSP
jgi:hypothetical protein